MKFLGDLGIDIKLLVAQIINFGLLLWLLKKFLYEPFIKRIESDELELKHAECEHEQLTKEEDVFRMQKDIETREARRKATEIIQEAEDLADKIKQKARIEVEEEKKAVIAQIHARLKELENE